MVPLRNRNSALLPFPKPAYCIHSGFPNLDTPWHRIRDLFRYHRRIWQSMRSKRRPENDSLVCRNTSCQKCVECLTKPLSVSTMGPNHRCCRRQVDMLAWFGLGWFGLGSRRVPRQHWTVDLCSSLYLVVDSFSASIGCIGFSQTCRHRRRCRKRHPYTRMRCPLPYHRHRRPAVTAAAVATVVCGW